MANFGKHLGINHAPATLAAHTAWYNGLTTAQKEGVIGYEVVVTDQVGQEIWKFGVSGLFPLVQTEDGTMSSYELHVNGLVGSIEDGDALKFADSGLFKFTFDNVTKEIKHEVKGTSADEGKFLGFGSDGSVSPTALPTAATHIGTPSLSVDFANNEYTHTTIVDNARGVDKDASGVFVRKAANGDNILKFENGALYVKDIQIDPASASRLSYDAATRTIGLTALGMNRVFVDDTSTTLSAAYTANGANMQEGDVVVVTQLQKVYINNGGTAVDETDWTLIETPAITDAAIRALFSANLGVAYNVATGNFTADVRAVTNVLPNDLKLDGNSLYVDIYGSNEGGDPLSKRLSDLRTDTDIAKNRTYTNALAKTTDANGNQTVAWGGDITQTTTVDAKNFDVNLNTTGTGMFLVNGTMRFTNSAALFEVVDQVNGFVRVAKVDEWGVLDLSTISPNA